MTPGPPLLQIYGLTQRTIISVFDVVKQDIRRRTAQIKLYAPFRLLPLLHRKGFDHIWKDGQMLEGREVRPGTSMTPESLVHMNPQYALDVINLVISTRNAQQHSSAIIAARITWVLTVRVEYAMPLRIWRNKPLHTNNLICRRPVPLQSFVWHQNTRVLCGSGAETRRCAASSFIFNMYLIYRIGDSI